VALKNIRGGVHASMKLRLVSDLPGVNPRTTQIEMLVMSLTALSSTFALRAS